MFYLVRLWFGTGTVEFLEKMLIVLTVEFLETIWRPRLLNPHWALCKCSDAIPGSISDEKLTALKEMWF